MKVFSRGFYNLVKDQILVAGSLNAIKKIGNHDKRGRQREVVYHKAEAKFSCACRLYESKGIPCSHIIRAMRFDHVEAFLATLICKRGSLYEMQQTVQPA
ncbi:hypothetical protein JHK82_040395 [Glycine max]|nr:hypothetical protein JHK86_040587 [Glycine max]KAG4966201.1 hypothetical protein JHK85_041176 [Glycine max]KAG5111172.1 hypothetical protein JHK82_040395 [Glycine max]KAG5122461.1 hypothetical protein JHK84_040801 [Glycine max]